jgi:sugar lactone lactonase YvrE
MNKNSLSRFSAIALLAALLVMPVWWSAKGSAPQNGNLPITAKNYAKQSSTTQSAPNKKKHHPIAPQVTGNLLFDNGSFDSVNGLASEINTQITDARVADDIVLTSTTQITCITAQIFSTVDPQTAQVEIYADNAGNGPVNTAPLFTFPSVSFTQVGTAFGLPAIEFTFNTSGVTLSPGKYWISAQSTDNGSGRGFFCTSGNGVIKNQPAYFKSSFFGATSWIPAVNFLSAPSDFAFRVYGIAGMVSLDHKTVYVADSANNRIQRSTDDGMTWKAVGFGPGTTAGKFNQPRGVSSNSGDSLVFVADTLNNRVQRSTDGGTTWQIFAGPGTAANQVNAPQGVAYDEFNDILYIADTNNSRILKATSASGAMPVFSVMAGPGLGVGQFNGPQSVAIDSLGNIFVADTNNNRVQMFTQNRSITSGWTVLAGPGTALGTVNRPAGVYVDGNGFMYIADTGNNRVQVSNNNVCWTPVSSITWSLLFGPGTAVGTVNAPQGVVYSSSGNVYVGDTGNNRIQKMPFGKSLAPSATVVGFPGTNIGQFSRPTSIR